MKSWIQHSDAQSMVGSASRSIASNGRGIIRGSCEIKECYRLWDISSTRQLSLPLRCRLLHAAANELQKSTGTLPGGINEHHGHSCYEPRPLLPHYLTSTKNRPLYEQDPK